MTLQWCVIALAVAASAVHAVSRLAPGPVRDARRRLALFLMAGRRSGVLVHLARRLAPPPTPGAGECGDCSSCAATPRNVKSS